MARKPKPANATKPKQKSEKVVPEFVVKTAFVAGGKKLEIGETIREGDIGWSPLESARRAHWLVLKTSETTEEAKEDALLKERNKKLEEGSLMVDQIGLQLELLEKIQSAGLTTRESLVQYLDESNDNAVDALGLTEEEAEQLHTRLVETKPK